MKKRMILISMLSLLMLSVAVAPVMAIGPTHALEVGNNPNLSPSGFKDVALMTPGGDRLVWGPTTFSQWADASAGQGRFNNAIIADIVVLRDMSTNPEDYLNKWIYLSGEVYGNKWNNPFDIPDRGEHGMLYWVLRSLPYPHEYAIWVALAYPDGIYLHLVICGQ